jgi:hypothetical protein
MNDLRMELEVVSNTEDAINMHIKYIAFCYVNKITDLATMISNKSVIYDCSYNYILGRLTEYIKRKYNVFIDENILMTYLDYYYDFN